MNAHAPIPAVGTAWPKQHAAHPATVIIAEVAETHGLHVSDLTGRRRTPRVAAVRREAMYQVAAKRKSLSLRQIGTRFGGRHYSTVIHALNRHAADHGLPPARSPKPSVRYANGEYQRIVLDVLRSDGRWWRPMQIAAALGEGPHNVRTAIARLARRGSVVSGGWGRYRAAEART